LIISTRFLPVEGKWVTVFRLLMMGGDFFGHRSGSLVIAQQLAKLRQTASKESGQCLRERPASANQNPQFRLRVAL
jgi:hypothetical protein